MTQEGIRCCVLASGSTGNAVYVEAGDTRILVDAGIGIRQLQGALDEIAVAGEDLDAVLVTHEHSDHIKGLSSVVRKWGLPIYTSEGTWQQIGRLWKEDEDLVVRIIRAGLPFTLGQFAIAPFPLSHDAEEPIGFSLHAGGEKLVIATDLGYASAQVKDATRGAHTYVLETNHDVEMLRVGGYPWHLKRRILGDKGHLSNDSAAEYLLDVMTDDTESVYLAHLSEENNRPQLAEDALSRALLAVSKRAREQIELTMTHPKRPTKMARIRSR